PPRLSRKARASGVSSDRDCTARSAPSSPLAWSSIACCRLALNDPLATSAAMPITMDRENSSSLRREARESLHAIFNMKLMGTAELPACSKPFVADHRPAFQPKNALAFPRQFQVVGHEDQRGAPLAIHLEDQVRHGVGGVP